MTTEYLTGAALYRAMADMLEGGREVQMLHGSAFTHYAGNGWKEADGIHAAYSYRFAPVQKQTVVVGYRDVMGWWHEQSLVAPETVAPKRDAIYFYPSARGIPADFQWNGDQPDLDFLADGLVFLALEDAKAMSEWLAVCRKGGLT